MKSVVAGCLAISLMSASALADAIASKPIYSKSVDGIEDVLKAKPYHNKLKPPAAGSVAPASPSLDSELVPGGKPGARPRIKLDGTRLPDAPSTRAFGSFGIPYTSTRVQDGGSGAAGTTPANFLSTTWPYGAIGKLVFTTPGGSSFCSASVIRRGLVVTAAHCVQDFGTGASIFTNYSFRPGHFGAAGATTAQIQPYGVWKPLLIVRSTTWANGTDIGSGSARDNDLAIFVMRRNTGAYIGDVVGYFGYSWNNLGFTSSALTGSKKVAATSTLGYPALLDGGKIMQRADGPTYLTTVGGAGQMAQGNNFTGGSSGGPWVLNFSGVDPVLSGGAVLGQQPFLATTGVTSWGSADPNAPKDNYSSQFRQNTAFPNSDYGGFGAGNIGFLINFACGKTAPEGGTFAANHYCD